MPNYDVIDSKEEYLGLRIRSKVPSKAYKDNYDRIFGNKTEQDGNPGSERKDDGSTGEIREQIHGTGV